MFLLIFLREFVIANYKMVKIILFKPKSTLVPGFIYYDVSDLQKVEIIIIAYSIALTPGTIVVDYLKDQKKLLLHAIDIHNPHEIRRHLDQNFKASIMRFTR